jgi:hypothetical protein
VKEERMKETEVPEAMPAEDLMGVGEWGPFPALWPGPWSAPRFRREVADWMIRRHKEYSDDPRHPESLTWDGETVVYRVKGDDTQTERYNPDPDGWYAICPSWLWDLWED